MTSKTTELCLLLVEETFGELAARIFKVLIIYGRQHLFEIVNRSGLSHSLVLQGIAVLIQQHIILWTSGAPTFYQADWLAAYSLVRSGKFVEEARKRLSPESLTILSRCVVEGDVDPMKAQVKETNGSSSEFHGDNALLSVALADLLDSESVIITNPSHFRPPKDTRTRAEKHVVGRNEQWTEKVKTADKPKYRQAIINTLHEWTFGSKQVKNDIRTRHTWNLRNSLKRQFDEIEGPTENLQSSRKTLKTSSSSLANSAAQNSTHLDVLIRANYGKYPVFARSKRLVQLAADNISIATSQVYAQVLRQCDKNIPCCDEFQPDDKAILSEELLSKVIVTAYDIERDAPNSNDLRQAIGQRGSSYQTATSAISPEKDVQGKKQRRLDPGESDDDNQPVPQVPVLDEDSDMEVDVAHPTRSTPNGREKTNGTIKHTPDRKGKSRRSMSIDYERGGSEDSDSYGVGAGRIIALRQHLQILTEHGLLTLHPPGTHEDRTEGWSVPFRTLSHRLRLAELNTTISSLFGSVALRLVRILQKHGKLEEKSLLNLALLESKEMRSRLSALHAVGYLELQEVPRDNNRAPSKTLYLWFFDEERCAHRMEQDYYHAMSRCLQRLRVERELVSDVLAKSMRSDVVGKEDEYIQGDEKTRLEQWRKVEDKLLAEVGRLDDGVLVLRDL